MRLQNHPGEHRFPVRPRWVYVTPVQRAATDRRPGRERLRLAAEIALPAVAVVGLGLLGEPGEVVLPVVLGILLAVLVERVLLAVRLARRPQRDQRCYAAWTGSPDLTDERQQQLALVADLDFAEGAWNSSIERFPSWRCLPVWLRQRHEHDLGRPLFDALSPVPPEAVRLELEQRLGVRDAEDLGLLLDGLLDDLSLSRDLESDLLDAEPDGAAARVASLTGLSTASVRALVEPGDGGRPALRLMAADVRRTIHWTRLGYQAEYLTAERAWQRIEHAAAVAARLFDDWDAWWGNARVAEAYVSDDPAAVAAFDANIAALRASGWPAASAPFPGWTLEAVLADRSGTGSA